MGELVVRQFSQRQDYQHIWRAMQAFTESRRADTADELWLLEHDPVYTQGQAGKPEHLLHVVDTPVIHSDRGGQITWHGPGQLMIYTLLDTHRLHLGVRALVGKLEKIIITVLGELDIAAYAKRDAPGVYVSADGQRDSKIAALGLRFRKKGCYHGVALNINCDRAAFTAINPCGYAGMPIARVADFFVKTPMRSDIEQRLTEQFVQEFQYQRVQRVSHND